MRTELITQSKPSRSFGAKQQINNSKNEPGWLEVGVGVVESVSCISFRELCIVLDAVCVLQGGSVPEGLPWLKTQSLEASKGLREALGAQDIYLP